MSTPVLLQLAVLSVRDCLPSAGDEVLAFAAHWWGKAELFGNVWHCVDGDESQIEGVTHWCAVPDSMQRKFLFHQFGG